nr:di-heme oxidoredictase family protein [Capnocytophaga canis]
MHFLHLISNYIHDKRLVMWLQGSSPIKALANQTFYPYTDMLLHDMGEDLADGRPDFLADGNEWKTRPLWGIGLQFLVNGHTEFLHDGRAKNVTEAILWHGGEAKDTKEKFKQLSKKDREDLLEFINSI